MTVFLDVASPCGFRESNTASVCSGHILYVTQSFLLARRKKKTVFRLRNKYRPLSVCYLAASSLAFFTCQTKLVLSSLPGMYILILLEPLSAASGKKRQTEVRFK